RAPSQAQRQWDRGRSCIGPGLPPSCPLPPAVFAFHSSSSQTGWAAADPASSGTLSSGQPLPPQLRQKAMAWQATYLLPLVLLVLLASGSWEQQSLLLQKLEGEEVFVRCDYPPQNSSKTKTWCRIIEGETCTLLVNNPRLGQEYVDPRFVIRDYPGQGYFTVTMTALAEKDSGLYLCGLHESSRINILRTISLAISRGES
uniref:Ig-like domain-containing protein n=1 Tax=Myotis lucifugus TaxID=59463 RepID=G1Q5A4_MYOLU